MQLDANRLVGLGLVEQTGLAFDADDGLGQCPGPDTARRIQFAEVGNYLLAHPVAGAYGSHQPPVNMHLAILGNGCVPQVHGRPSWAFSGNEFKRVGCHYIAFWQRTPHQQRTYGDKLGENSHLCV